MAENSDINTTEIAEFGSYMAWKAEEPDGEVTYHLELGMATLHFFEEEWKEFLELAKLLN